MRRMQFQGPHSAGVLAAAIFALAVLVPAPPTRADFQFGGIENSWEWLTDASTVIVTAHVKKAPSGANKTFTLSVETTLKQPKGSNVKTKEDLKVKFAGPRPDKGQVVLLFLGANLREPIAWASLPEGGEEPKRADGQGDYILPDKKGRKMRRTNELLKKIAERVERGRVMTPDRSPWVSDAGFAIYPSASELDTNESYYHVRVPPDENFRPSLEERAAEEDIEASSILYRFYAGRSREQREADRRLDIINMLREAREKAKPSLSYQSYISYPERRLVKLSPDAEYAAVLERGTVSVYSLEDDALLFEAQGNYYRGNHPILSMIFSPDSSLFARLQATGDVSVYSMTERKLQSTCKLGWPSVDSAYPKQFTFSPDSKYVALNVAQGFAGEGSAVLVWKTADGKNIYVKSPKWRLQKEFHFAGFNSRSEHIQVMESTYWNLEQGHEHRYVASDWRRPNAKDESEAYGKLVEVNVATAPRANASQK